MRRQTVALFVVLAAACILVGCKKSGGPGGATGAAANVKLDEVYKTEAVVGFLAVPSLSTTFANAEKLAALAGPVPPGALQAMVVQGLLTLGLKDTSVVDLSAPAALVLLDPKQYPVPIVFAATTRGEDQVLKALQPAWKHQGVKEGVHELVREHVDTYGVFAGGAEKPPTVKETMYMAFSGHSILCAPTTEGLQAGRPALEALLGVRGKDLVGGLDISRLRKIFSAEIEMARQEVQEEIARDMEHSGQQVTPQTVAVMQRMLDFFFSLYLQIDRLEASAALDEKAVHIETAVLPAKDSAFSRLLGEQKKTPLKLLGALPPEHPIAVGINLQWESLKPALEEFTNEIFDLFIGKKLPPETMELFKQMWQQMGDEVVFSEAIGGGISLVEIIAVKDEKKAREIFRKAFQLVSDLLKDWKMEGLGFSFEGPLPSDLSEAPTDLFHFKFKFGEDDSPKARAMAEAMKTIYGGDSLKMAMAFSQGTMILTMSPDPEKLMRETLKRMKDGSGGLSSSASFRSAAGPYLEKSGGFMYMSIAQIMTESVRAAMASRGAGAEMPAAKTPLSGIFLGGYCDAGRLNLVLRLPAEHLKETGEALRGLMSPGMH